MTSRCSFPLTVVTISFPFNAVIKQLLDSVFGDVQNNQGLVKADNPSYRDLDYYGYHKNRIQQLFIIYNCRYCFRV